MKTMKKIGALALALCLVLAMGATALAADLGALNDPANTTNVDSFTINVILDKKAGVNSPANTVTFTVAPANATDVANPYKVGPADGIKFEGTGNTASFPVNPTDAQCTQAITVTTDKTQFIEPGIYRYVISETVNKTALGFAAADAATKYIDVYVKRDVGTGCIVYGAAMSPTLEANKALGTKDSDFNISYTTDDGGTPTDPSDDDPKSYDVVISKTVTGAMGDPSESFSFALTLKALADAEGVKVPVTLNGAIGAAELVLDDVDVTSTYTMKGGESFTLKGLPKTLAIEVVESVAGLDGYTTTMSVTNMDSADTTTNRTAKGTVSGEGGAIAFTNDRDTVSPTGVIMRVAPLVILLGASVVFFAMSRKRRENKA